MGCGDGKGVVLQLERLLSEQGGMHSPRGAPALLRGWRAGTPTLQGWVPNTLPKPQPSPCSTFLLSISLIPGS